MTQLYHSHGVRFRYPNDWELSEEGDPNQPTITVASLETSFWSLTLDFQRPKPEELIESAVDVFRDEYPEIDVYPVEAELCRQPSVARDVEFVCLDVVNSAFLRAIRTRHFSAFVLYQGTDVELEETRAVLESITASLCCDDEPEPG